MTEKDYKKAVKSVRAETAREIFDHIRTKCSIWGTDDSLS